MNCKIIEELILTDYVDGKLRGEALQEVEAHIASCANCRKIAEKLALAEKAFKDIDREEPPPTVWHNIKAEISVRHNRLFPSLSHLRPAVLIATAVLLVFFTILVTQIMPGKSIIQPAADQDDILALASTGEGWNGEDYDLGTSVEEYFL